MSDENEVEQLLENFQKALDTLNNIGNVEALITKLDAHKNRKLLKRVKHVVNEVHNKVGTVKEKVSKAYKRVKIRSSSESEDIAITGNTDKDASDKEEDPLGHSKNTLKNVDDERRYSPIIGGKGKALKRSTRQTDKPQKDKNEQNDSLQSSNNASIDEDCLTIEEDGEKDSLDQDGMDVDTPEANEDRNIEIQVIADDKEDNASEKNSSQEIIEGTPEKSGIKITLPLYNHKNKSSKERSLLTSSDVVESSSDAEQQNQQEKNNEISESGSENKDSDEDDELTDTPEKSSSNKIKHSKQRKESKDSNSKETEKNAGKTLLDGPSDSETDKSGNEEENQEKGTEEDEIVAIEDTPKKNKHKKSGENIDKHDNNDSDEEDKVTDSLKKSGTKKIKQTGRGDESRDSDSDETTKKKNTAKTPLDVPSDSDETDKSSNEEENQEKATEDDEDEIVTIEDTSKKNKHKKSRGKKDKNENNDSDDQLNDSLKKSGAKKIKHTKRGDESKDSDSDDNEKIENTAKKTLDKLGCRDEADNSSDEEKSPEKGNEEDEIVAIEDTSKKNKHKKSRGKKDKNENKDSDDEDQLNDSPKKSGAKKIKYTKWRDESKDSDSDDNEKIENTAKKTLDKLGGRDEADNSSDEEKSPEKGNEEDEIVAIEDTSKKNKHKKSRGKKDKNENKDSDDEDQLNDSPKKSGAKKIKYTKRGDESKDSDSDDNEKIENTAKKTLDKLGGRDEADNSSDEEKSPEKDNEEDEIVAIEDTSKKNKHKKSRGKKGKNENKDSDDEDQLNDSPKKSGAKKIKYTKRGDESKDSDSDDNEKIENTAKKTLDKLGGRDEADNSSDEEKSPEKGNEEDEIVAIEDTSKKNKHKKSRGKKDKNENKDSDDEDQLNDSPKMSGAKKIKYTKRGDESKDSDSDDNEKIENTAKKTLDKLGSRDEADKSSDEEKSPEKGNEEDEIVAIEDTSKKNKHKKSRGKKDKNENKDSDDEDQLNDSPKKSGAKKIKHTKRGDESKDSDSDNTEKMKNTAKKSRDKPGGRDEANKSSDEEKGPEKGNDEDEIVTIEDTPKKTSGETNDENEGNDSSDNDSANPILTLNSVKTEDDIENRPPIPKIKLVDINKLLAPNTKPLDAISPSLKTKKSVTFDSSVIILSSSDEETPKKDPKAKDPSPLKSAMRTSSKKAAAAHNDSDAKENKEKSRSTRTTRQTKPESKILISDQSSDDSDSEFNRRSRRIRSHEACLKDKFSKLASKYGERKSRAAARKTKEHDSEREDKSEKKKKKRTKDKKLHSDSENNSDSEEEGSSNAKNKKRRKKKELLETSSLSDHSDMSDSAFEVSSKRKSGPKSRTNRKKARVILTKPDKDDQQFRAKVYIPLPLFKCEELPDIYKRKKDIFEVKKLTKMDFTRRTRSTRNGSSKSSDDSDKPDKKRIKLTLKLKKKAKEDSSDDERSGTEEDDVDKEKRGKTDTKDIVDVSEREDAIEDPLVEACLEQIKDSDKEESDKQSDDNKSDEDNTTKKKEKNKKNKNIENNNKECDKDSSKDAEKDKDEEPNENGVLSDGEENSDDNQKDDKDEEDGSTDEDEGKKKKGKKWKNDKLLKEKIDTSDSDEDFAKFSKKKDKSNSELVRKAKKRMKKSAVISDSDSDSEKKSKNSDEDYKSDKSSESNSDSEKEDKDDESDQGNKNPARKRIKRVKDSSSDDDDKSTRKHLRKMIDKDSLSDTTKKAEQEEKERKARIAEKQEKYNQIFALKSDAIVDKVVLDFDEKTDKALLSVNKKLVKQLKPHQVIGIKFMWDACFESLERLKKDKGSGCILAHCMGLGKTLQVITLIHTLLSHSEKTKVEKILVVCPVNTVLNWKSEFKKWLPKNEFEVYDLVSCKTTSINYERNYIVREWHENGGVLIIGYNMFRTLSNPDNKAISKKLRQSFQEGLVDPGPDLIVCDEGHLLKNEKTHLSIAMNRIKTQRRIVLTGTPLQNNLKEYWCMVQFIKPNLLGTYKEYMNRFVNPIINGQYTDSTQHDIIIMRRRSHVLHKLLDGVVQRQDYSVLEPYLPPKYEYVLFLKLTEVQIKLYTHYMEHFARKGDGSNRTSFLFTDFQQLQRMCTHPRVLLDKSIQDKEREVNEETDSEGSLKEFIDDDSEAKSTSSSESGSASDASIKSDEKKKNKSSSKKKRLTRAQAAQKRDNGDESDSEVEILEPKEWWQEYIDKEELDNINHSVKTFLLFEILRECEEIGDKILVFSQSLYTLNCIEYFLQRIDDATQKGETEKVGGHSGSWAIGLDYFRLDGSSSCDNRASWCDQFNDPDNTRARLFLISTKAGGLGINLVAANRVIIFDVSWNPSHDIQSIYRVYRFGQTKPSYIYRFVAHGAMEMKIYERQVTKQAISKRVIDEQQIDRHYSQNDIQELYKTDLDPKDRPIPLVPKDVLLGELLQKHENTIFKYHEHQSLLENKQDEELNEDERKAAWEEFENEKVVRKTSITNFGGINLAALQQSMNNFSPQLIQVALANIVRKDNPLWSEVQIRGILPALVTQLQMQMAENDFSMYNRVQQEIRLMQALQAQRMRENYLKQYQLQMLQKQQMANQMLGNLNVDPEELSRLQAAAASQNYIHPSSSKSMAGGSGDVIELND